MAAQYNYSVPVFSPSLAAPVLAFPSAIVAYVTVRSHDIKEIPWGGYLSRELAIGLSVVAISMYLLTVRLLRYKRIDGLQKKYGYTADQFKDLNYKEAQEIVGALLLFESPWMFLTGKDFAFLRAFAIPSISNVSVAAKEMVDKAGKRYADTTVLVGEWIVNPLDSERGRTALNRVNFIHSRYGSKITNDQMVYTLCLLVSEGLKWVDQYDWRTSTALEKHASYVFWKEVGIRMGIAERTIPQSYEDCSRYVQDFEAVEMGPAIANQRIAQAVIRLYNSTIPGFLRPLFTSIIISFMDNTLREAFILPAVSNWILKTIEFALVFRAFFVRHLMLPRYSTPQIFQPKNSVGSYSLSFWEIEPWYVSKSFLHSWGPMALYNRFFGLPMVGASQWKTEGYKLEAIGPGKWDGRGAEEVMKIVKRGNEGGCPYSTFGWIEDEASLGGIYAEHAEKAKQGGGVCPMMRAQAKAE
ncbi:hypothetical protein RUND412_002723 [Rhizina undulata]